MENSYKTWLKSQGQTDQLADMDVAEAIEVLAHQEQWPKCKQVAQENGALSTYLVLHASHLLKATKPLIPLLMDSQSLNCTPPLPSDEFVISRYHLCL